MERSVWVLIHRWAGLAMTGFLIVVGLTGSLLAFLPELNRTLTPNLFPPDRGGVPLRAAFLAETAERLVPQGLINGVYLGTPGTAMVHVAPRIESADDEPSPLPFNQLFLDPYTAEEFGRRWAGGLPDGLDNLMPFIYELHEALALGEIGAWILGAVALIWSVDCFVAFYLTLPARRKDSHATQGYAAIAVNAPASSGSSVHTSNPTRSFWQRWKPAWKIRWRAGSYRLNFDLHRAGGLWVWAALLMFAWSSVGFNMSSVYRPVMQRLFDFDPESIWTMPPLAKPLEQPQLGWQQAQDIAERLLDEQARLHGFSVEKPIALYLNRRLGFYAYWVRSSLDIQDEDKNGATVIAVDANSGELKGLHLPTGQRSGNTLSRWLVELHMARVFGMPYKIFVCILGLMIVMLSVTGVVIWLRKRRAKRTRAFRRAPPMAEFE